MKDHSGQTQMNRFGSPKTKMGMVVVDQKLLGDERGLQKASVPCSFIRHVQVSRAKRMVPGLSSIA